MTGESQTLSPSDLKSLIRQRDELQAGLDAEADPVRAVRLQADLEQVEEQIAQIHHQVSTDAEQLLDFSTWFPLEEEDPRTELYRGRKVSAVQASLKAEASEKAPPDIGFGDQGLFDIISELATPEGDTSHPKLSDQNRRPTTPSPLADGLIDLSIDSRNLPTSPASLSPTLPESGAASPPSPLLMPPEEEEMLEPLQATWPTSIKVITGLAAALVFSAVIYVVIQ